MDLKVIEYLVYLPTSVLLTYWVASTLHKHGRRFLVDVFKGDEGLADSVNHLLVVGFYLINLGYVSLQLRLDTIPGTYSELVEAFAWKVGLVLVVLGVMHFFNIFVLSGWRRRSQRPTFVPTMPPPGQFPPYTGGPAAPQPQGQV
jgi:hypothetical protein